MKTAKQINRRAMNTHEQLIKAINEARQYSAIRGHKMILKRRAETIATLECENVGCNASAFVNTQPAANETTIAGEAVALDCKGKAQTKRMRLVIHAGKRYEVDESGRISYTREDGSGWQGSEDWVFLGLMPINCVYPRIITWDHIKKHGLPAPLYYKNGKCRYTVADRDHGTMRTWGNPAVASIHLETVNA